MSTNIIYELRVVCRSGDEEKYPFTVYTQSRYLFSTFAGVSLWLGLLGFDVGLHFHDTRHWDYENNRWEVYDEDSE